MYIPPNVRSVTPLCCRNCCLIFLGGQITIGYNLAKGGEYVHCLVPARFSRKNLMRGHALLRWIYGKPLGKVPARIDMEGCDTT